MSVESFGGLDGGEGLDPSAFEKFQEQMRDNAAHIAALQKAQAKQKQQEDKLVKILLKFIQTSSKKDLVILVTQLLEQNVPAGFVLALIMLGNEDIQQAAGIKLALPDEDMARLEATEAARGDVPTNERGVVVFGDNPSVLPLKVRIGIDLWAQNIAAAGMANPNKVLDSVYMPGTRPVYGTASEKDAGEIKDVVVKTATYVVNEFVTSNRVEGAYGQIYDFAHFLLKGILDKIEESITNQELRAGEKDREYEE